MSGFADELVAGETLVRSAIRSPNYVPGVSGWRIAKDGTIEANDGDFRGTLHIGDTGSFIDVSATIPAELSAYYLAKDGIALVAASARYSVDLGASGTFYAYEVIGAKVIGATTTVIHGFGLVDNALKVTEIWRATNINGNVSMTIGAHDPVTLKYLGGLLQLGATTIELTNTTNLQIDVNGDWQIGGFSAPRGLLDGVTVTTTTGALTAAASAETNIPILELAGVLAAGRTYRIVFQCAFTATVATDLWNISVRTSAAVTGPLIGSASFSGSITPRFEWIIQPPSSGAVNVFFSFARQAGTGTLQAFGAPTTGVSRTLAYLQDITDQTTMRHL